MNFIDKTLLESEGLAIINNLLANAWNETDGCYYGADYSGLSRPEYKIDLVKLILKEQNGVCCYCLKEIDSSEVTLEHLIPQHDDEVEFEKYLVDQTRNRVQHLSRFDKKILVDGIRYPHDISYHNLLASCNSKGHCNGFRGNKFIKPLIFDKLVGEKVTYDIGGISYSQDYSEAISVLGLSIDKNLRLIRSIWYEISCTIDDLSDFNFDTLESLIYEMMGKYEKDALFLLENFTGNPSYRNDVIKYKWFYHYYKRMASI